MAGEVGIWAADWHMREWLVIAPLSPGKVSGDYSGMLICDICMMLYHYANTQKFQGPIRYHFKTQSLKLPFVFSLLTSIAFWEYLLTLCTENYN